MHPGEMGFRHKDLLLRKGRGLCWVSLVLCFVPWYFFIRQFLVLAALGELGAKEGKIPASMRCAWCCRDEGLWVRAA